MNAEKQFNDLNISTNPFLLTDLREANALIKKGKVHREYGIAPEVLKRCDLDEIVLDFCNKALVDKIVLEQWRISNIIPVPKKGDLTDTNNYRGISLMSLVAQVLNRMILYRIKSEIEKVLRDNQNGFQEGHSMNSHILTLQRILEGMRAKQLLAVIIFINFKKAFDSVHRGTLIKILLACNIPKAIVDIIGLLYTNMKACVITPGGMTSYFDMQAGVLQEDMLAPYLFIIAVYYHMRQAIKSHPE